MNVVKRVRLTELFPRSDKLMVDLLYKIFEVDPKKRITIDQLMIHPFVNKFKGRISWKMPVDPIKI